MIEVAPNLFVGSQADGERHAAVEGWAIVHACKEPFHRAALGYTGRAAPKDHPEYLIAQRGRRLCLNLVDVPDPAYIRAEIIDAALAFIGEHLAADLKVLVHCNQGESRGPTIAFLSLVQDATVSGGTFDEAAAAFRSLYPAWRPAAGILGYARANFTRHRGGS